MPFPFQLTADQKDQIVSTVKLGGAWGSVWMANSADIANMAQAVASTAAAIYTTFLVIEWVIKKVIVPLRKRMKDRHAAK